MPKITKRIPYKTFNKLWISAQNFNTKREFINHYLFAISDEYIDFEKKYNLKFESAYDFLSEIYNKANITLKEIMDTLHLQNKDLVNTFCLSRRTVEEWKAGRNHCPDHIRLMILRHFNMLHFKDYIVIC